MPKLVFHDSDGVDKPLQLGTEPILIGRASDCQVQTHDAMVSRKHARITFDGSGYVIEDLGSSNGVFLGSDKVQRAAFRPGDVVTCGSLVLRMLPDARQSGTAVPKQPSGPRTAILPDPLPRAPEPAVSVEWNTSGETSASPPLAASGDLQKLRAELRRETDRREQAEAALLQAEQRSNVADEAAREMIQLRRRVEQLQSELQNPGTQGAGYDVEEASEAVAVFNDALAELKASLRAGVDEAQLLTAPSASVRVVRDALRSAMDELERARQRLREMINTLNLPTA